MNDGVIKVPETPQPTILTIVAAMHCEVKPLVDALRLQKKCDKPFALFRGEFRGKLKEDCKDESSAQIIEVVVSGIGALAMATAVGWIGGQNPSIRRAWLNVGTAGHGSAELGSAFRVHASTDILSERKIYPAMVAKTNFATDEILSVNAPSTDYPDTGAIDMEAYAFFSAAYKFSSAELAESIKVISDTPSHDIEELNAAKISALVTVHTQAILDLGTALLSILMPALNPTGFEIPDLRATHSQRQQVNALITKLAALNALSENVTQGLRQSASVEEILGVLNEALLMVEPQIDAASNHG